MKQMVRLIVLIVFLLVALDLVLAQTQPNQKKAATSQKPKSETLELGKSYAALRPEQKTSDRRASFATTTPPPEATLLLNRPTTTLDCPSAPRSTL